MENERGRNLNDIHEKWLTDLKGQYTLVPIAEWKTMKTEMKYIREHIIPVYNRQQSLKQNRTSVHLDTDYRDDDELMNE